MATHDDIERTSVLTRRARANQIELSKSTYACAVRLRAELNTYQKHSGLTYSPIHGLTNSLLLVMAEQKLLEAALVMEALSKELEEECPIR